MSCFGLHSFRVISTQARPLVARQIPRVSRRWTSSGTEGPTVTATNRAETSLKRFWKAVDVENHNNGFSITLDKRPLKTPSGNKLHIPQTKKLVATLIANEWENQETLLKPHALPMTSLASRAIDAMNDEATRSEVRAALLKYLDTDTICFHQDYPQALVDLQQAHWDPLLAWARQKYDIEILTFDSIFAKPQPAETVAKLDYAMSKFDLWEMAALERATYTCKSFLVALALVMRQITVEQAAAASFIEVASQIQTWGEVEDSHDVDYHDVRRQLSSAACLLAQI